jgi:hypothetical protein
MKLCRRAHMLIYTCPRVVVRLKDMYGVAVGGRRQQELPYIY